MTVGFLFGLLRIGQRSPEVWMVGNASDFARDCVRRQDNIDKTGTNGAARHRIELCAGFSLREGQTAGRLDRTQTGCSVAAGSRKHDPDRPWKTAAFHLYPRNIPQVGPGMGRAIRTDRYRLVEWTAPSKDKFRVYLEKQFNGEFYNGFNTLPTSTPEASTDAWGRGWIPQARWTRAQSNRLLFEAGKRDA